MECVNDNRRCWSAEISRIDPELGKHKKKSFNFSQQQQQQQQHKKKKKKKNEGVNIWQRRVSRHSSQWRNIAVLARFSHTILHVNEIS